MLRIRWFPHLNAMLFLMTQLLLLTVHSPSSRCSANRYPEPSIMRYTNARHCSGSTMLHSVACICVFVYTAFTTSFCAPSWLAYCLSGNVHTLNKQLPSAHIRHHTARTALSGRRPFILTGIAQHLTFYRLNVIRINVNKVYDELIYAIQRSYHRERT